MGQTTLVLVKQYLTRRAKYLQRLMDHLWNRWRRKYVPALRESHRLKLDSAGQTVQMGDIVSVNDESLPRPKWKMGVVHELIKEVDKRRGEHSSALLTCTRKRVNIYGVLCSASFPLKL